MIGRAMQDFDFFFASSMLALLPCRCGLCKQFCYPDQMVMRKNGTNSERCFRCKQKKNTAKRQLHARQLQLSIVMIKLRKLAEIGRHEAIVNTIKKEYEAHCTKESAETVGAKDLTQLERAKDGIHLSSTNARGKTGKDLSRILISIPSILLGDGRNRRHHLRLPSGHAGCGTSATFRQFVSKRLQSIKDTCHTIQALQDIFNPKQTHKRMRPPWVRKLLNDWEEVSDGCSGYDDNRGDGDEHGDSAVECGDAAGDCGVDCHHGDDHGDIHLSVGVNAKGAQLQVSQKYLPCSDGRECRIGELTGAHNGNLGHSDAEGGHGTGDVGGHGDVDENDSDVSVAINLLQLSAIDNAEATQLQFVASRADNDDRVDGNELGPSDAKGSDGTGDVGGQRDAGDKHPTDGDVSIAANLLQLSASVNGEVTQLQLAPSPQLPTCNNVSVSYSDPWPCLKHLYIEPYHLVPQCQIRKRAKAEHDTLPLLVAIPRIYNQMLDGTTIVRQNTFNAVISIPYGLGRWIMLEKNVWHATDAMCPSTRSTLCDELLDCCELKVCARTRFVLLGITRHLFALPDSSNDTKTAS